ncbi:calcium-binding protein [Thalassobius sp. Cn5-15]|uniref:calcium-binding protein n=1 Tax=Thalassobius sp. Cn5-15 TaxID=2917763 RepID=UPI001EF34B76|nr:calcium-binding protein [Thalassobius sp. Cn5-15]MCG7494817.1 type I secretion protein [Thalassobius sp. Cn5-15]
MPTERDNLIIGTGVADTLSAAAGNDTMVGLAGDDTLAGDSGNDLIYGDYAEENLLGAAAGALSFADYGSVGDWQVSTQENGLQEMTQSVATEAQGVYSLSMSLAANFAAGHVDAGLQVLVDGVVVASYDSQSGAFSDHSLTFTATGSTTDITLRAIAGEGSGPVIDTSGAVFSTAAQMTIGGQEVTVAAFAPGQANLYQVFNGTLHVFETDSASYQRVGAAGTVNVNAIGFNQEDSLIYGVAVSNGSDALGNAVSRDDLVMFDATGAVYRIGEGPFRSWTGDFDDQGNLWIFNSRLNFLSKIDVDSFDADGNPLETRIDLNDALFGLNVYDLSFDAATQSFSGVARGAYEGAPATLVTVDVSGDSPQISSMAVTHTEVDGQLLTGTPAITFGAAIYDTDGTLFVGGNSGDHDMNNATRSAGGIYRVDIAPDGASATLVLVSDAPRSYSNDGAADPTALNPFEPVDLEATMLLRDLALVATTEGDLSYNDDLQGGAGADTMEGGIGDDLLTGGSIGDSLMGGAGDDSLHGGAGFDAVATAPASTYDADGLRYDHLGNLLPENDDWLAGGIGNDLIAGSAGHDTLLGGTGADTLQGGTGFDHLMGGEGADDLNGGSDRDTLEGGAGADTLDGRTGDDLLQGGADTDLLRGSSGNDSLYGDAGEDLLQGGSHDDLLVGGIGADTLEGGGGADDLRGDAGADSLLGGSGNDALSGGADNDTLSGSSGEDILDGGAGRDRLNGGSGADILMGGEGRDTLAGASGADELHGGSGRDNLFLGAGDDVAWGGEDADRFIFRDRDLDGSSVVIRDYDLSEGDYLDLRGLSLGDAATWFGSSVTQDDAGTIHVDLGQCDLSLTDTGLNLLTQADQLYDSFVF